MAIASFSKVGVVGAGQMGLGIAQLCATKGLTTTLVDIDKNQLQQAEKNIGRSLDKFVEKQKISDFV